LSPDVTIGIYIGWFVLLALLIVHVIVRRDIGSGAKVLVIVLLILLPVLAAIGYGLAFVFTRLSRPSSQRPGRD
jgi:hypothetical protein